MEYILKVENITWNYGDRSILNDITFNMNKGKFITVLGPNGSGKTTLLRNISASLTPPRGRVLLQGEDVFSMKRKTLARHMAVVTQNTVVDYDFSVLDIVLMGRSPHLNRFQSEGVEDVRICRQVMELTNTWHLRDRVITQLSGGECQRVVVARALAQQPKLLLLDEPTSHLDIQHQVELLSLLRNLNKTIGLSVLTVLHDINLAALFSDYLLVMKDGKIVARGSSSEIITPGLIKEVYGLDVIVNKSPVNNSPYIIPVPSGKRKRRIGVDTTVHIICGGGTGGYLMEQLKESGFRVTAGVVNIGDSDWQTAKIYDIPMAEEKPFSPISDTAHRANLQLIKQADVVILTDISVGPGNLKNLEAVQDAIKWGKKLIIIEDSGLAQRDFTGGRAKELMDEAAGGGVVRVETAEEAWRLLQTGETFQNSRKKGN